MLYFMQVNNQILHPLLFAQRTFNDIYQKCTGTHLTSPKYQAIKLSINKLSCTGMI